MTEFKNNLLVEKIDDMMKNSSSFFDMIDIKESPSIELKRLKTKFRFWQNATDSQIRLIMGEISSQSIRDIKAVLNQIIREE